MQMTANILLARPLLGCMTITKWLRGLCNSPVTFARMMTSIFGDQNHLSLLCSLDDLLLFGKSEQEALDQLGDGLFLPQGT